jgi:hypothetical protein
MDPEIHMIQWDAADRRPVDDLGISRQAFVLIGKVV